MIKCQLLLIPEVELLIQCLTRPESDIIVTIVTWHLVGIL